MSNLYFGLSTVDALYIGESGGTDVYIGEETALTPVNYAQEYLTFEILTDGVVLFADAIPESAMSLDISYSLDNGSTWTTINSSTNTGITVSEGDKILFKGVNSAYGTNQAKKRASFSGDAYYNVCGNIMSLIYGDNFSGQTELTTSYTFDRLFVDGKVINAKNLILPSTALTNYCYEYMFSGCTELINTPALPATSLAQGCYQYMFRNTAITKVPALPATTLAVSCYAGMFRNTQISTVPSDLLPATALDRSCYEYMFLGSALVEAPDLPAETVAQYSYRGMFQSCHKLTKAPAFSATTMGQQSCMSMFESCDALVEAPVLPATTLANSCYKQMFTDCTALATIPSNMLPATTLVSACYNFMFSGCTSLTTSPELPAATLISGCYQSMFTGCTSLNSVKCLATTIPTNTTKNWLSGVSATGTFTKDPNMSSWTTGVNGIPDGWTVVDAS